MEQDTDIEAQDDTEVDASGLDDELLAAKTRGGSIVDGSSNT